MSQFKSFEQPVKVCVVCGVPKRVSCFTKRKSCSDGRANRCNACVREASREKKVELEAMLDELMMDPEFSELMKSLDGLGDDM